MDVAGIETLERRDHQPGNAVAVIIRHHTRQRWIAAMGRPFFNRHSTGDNAVLNRHKGFAHGAAVGGALAEAHVTALVPLRDDEVDALDALAFPGAGEDHVVALLRLGTGLREVELGCRYCIAIRQGGNGHQPEEE